MVQASQRTALSGPALIRLLARLSNADIPEAAQPLSERLSQWLGWTDAIALSTALNGNPPTVAASARTNGHAEADECRRVRASLVKAITGDSALVAPKRRASEPAPAPETAADFPLFRQRYLALQQSMETDIGDLRARLRSVLAAGAPGTTRLAMVDAVMEQALGARERSLLASVPAILAGHFERLRRAEHIALADAEASGDTATMTPGAWLVTFRKDMQSVLLAELDLRFQPVEGLLAALRTR